MSYSFLSIQVMFRWMMSLCHDELLKAEKTLAFGGMSWEFHGFHGLSKDVANRCMPTYPGLVYKS